MQYGVRWEVLAAINEIETDYGRNLNVSSAGALGWMQFMPATWKMYGVDANRDGEKDPYNPVDAIFAAARYLRAAGADTDLRRAIFAYNHADWYVDSVLLRARVIGGLPSDLVGSLTGLTQGRFPVHAKATYAGKLEKADQKRKIRQGANAAVVVESDGHRRGIDIFAKKGAPGDRRQRRQGGPDRPQQAPRPLREAARRLRQHLHLRAPRQGRRDLPGAAQAHRQALGDPPRAQARQGAEGRRLGDQGARSQGRAEARPEARPKPAAPVKQRLSANGSAPAMPAKERLFAHPERPNARAAGGAAQLGQSPAMTPSDTAPIGFDKKDFVTKKMRRGRPRDRRHHRSAASARARRTRPPHMLFEIRPAGRGAPRVDPKPILDGWKLLESTAIYRAAKEEPLLRRRRQEPDDRPDPADEQGDADPARPRRPADRGLRLRRVRRPLGPDRPARARHARVPGRLGPEAHGLLAALRPRLPDRLGQRLRALDRHRGRHRRRQRRRRSSATRAPARSPTSRSSAC